MFVCSFQVADQKMLVVVEWEDFACRLACVNPAGAEEKRREGKKKKRGSVPCRLAAS